MLTTGPLSGQTNPAEHRAPIELHWMTEPDLELHEQSGLAVPALCGTWMQPDEHLATNLAAGAPGYRYVSCAACDLLHDLGTDPLSA